MGLIVKFFSFRGFLVRSFVYVRVMNLEKICWVVGRIVFEVDLV